MTNHNADYMPRQVWWDMTNLKAGSSPRQVWLDLIKLTLRQAACQDRSGETLRMNWSCMGDPQPMQTGGSTSRPARKGLSGILLQFAVLYGSCTYHDLLSALTHTYNILCNTLYKRSERAQKNEKKTNVQIVHWVILGRDFDPILYYKCILLSIVMRYDENLPRRPL
jgi:hypothetical protein